MRKILFLLAISGLFLTVSPGQGTATWYYHPELEIQFSPQDTALSNPFLCTTDSSGNLWLISSTSTSLDAHDALYKAAPGDTVFTLIDDYSDDADVHSTRGITNIGNDIYVMCRSTSQYISFMYRYPDGNFSERTRHDQQGYGTYVYGIDATRDAYIFGGIIYQGPRIRGYDYTPDADPFGHYIPYECDSRDPGGPSATGEDAIRDVAVIPEGDYFDPATPVYTSRNSLPDGNTGGVTKWTGGVQDSLTGYEGVSIDDASSFLRWTRYVPNGLTCDRAGHLYAVGTDTTRRWVKVFQIDGNWATQVAELPSSTSGDIPDPEGAPLAVPEDVALSPDENTAYVIDLGANRCFVFTTSEEVQIDPGANPTVAEFELLPAYPNPFNPVTHLTYRLPRRSLVTIELYDLKGHHIRTLQKRFQSSGQHRYTWDARQLPSGIYFYTIATENVIKGGKIVLLK